MLNGANGAMLIKSDGTLEVVQFQTVSDLGNDRYQLSTLLRGRRGTDTMATGHAAGERFILLEPTTLVPGALALGDLDVARFFNAVTFGLVFERGTRRNKTFIGRDLMPYAPHGVTAALSGSDIVIDWFRRTRLGGELKDGTGDVPLAETTESYEIDIYDAAGTTVLRTLTATASTITYTAADIVTDFGATPAELNLAVYQISEAVGRGFSTQQTIPVE